MRFCGNLIIGIQFGINYTRTTFNLELIMSVHHFIKNKFPIPNSSWSNTAMQHTRVISQLHFTQCHWKTFCLIHMSYISSLHLYRPQKGFGKRVWGLRGYPRRNWLYFTRFVIGRILSTPPPLSPASTPPTFRLPAPSSPPLLISPSSSLRQHMQGLVHFAPFPHVLLLPSLSSLLLIPFFFTFESPDPVRSFST